MKTKDRTQIIKRVGIATIVGNVVLAAGKALAGIFGNSMAMISDAVHSLSDVFSTVIVMIGAKFAGNRADKDHNYGHERFESVASVVLAMLLFGTAIVLFYGGVKSIVAAVRAQDTFAPPTTVALVAAIVSIVAKAAMYFYTMHYARKIDSQGLKADAWHHLSDSLSSIGSFVGILGAMLSVYVLDGAATLVIALLIAKVAIGIALDVVKQLTDHAAPDETVERIKTLIGACEGVLRLDDLKTRLAGAVVYVEAEIAVDPTLNIVQAHDVAQQVHDRIEAQVEHVKHVTVHVNPYRCDEQAPSDGGNEQ